MTEPFIVLSPYSNRVFVNEWSCQKHPEIARDAKMKCTICNSEMESRSREIPNAKNYPYFGELVALLNFTGEHVIQIGVVGENRIPGVEDFFLNLPFVEIEKLLLRAKLWISVDNFLPHLAHAVKGTKGIVIWGTSDPQLVGYPEFTNILKDRKYIRPDHWKKWNLRTFNPEAFVAPEVVANAVVQLNREL
jgi:hypothetical protein